MIGPELGSNVANLGLIHGIRTGDGRIEVDMMLAGPPCPAAGAMATEVEQTVHPASEEVDDVEASHVFELPWAFEHLSESAEQTLEYEG